MMNLWRYHQRIDELERGEAAYALATVVVRRAPVSAHLGDRAIVTADGLMEGFVGGSCSRDIVRRQGLDAIRTGIPRLLQIRPDSLASNDEDNGETVVVPMGCASEGAVDVYIEPHLPARILLIVGHTPVAAALAQLASVLDGYHVQRIVAGDEMQDLGEEASASAIAIESLAGYLAALGAQRERLVAVVASQGHYDERALAILLSGTPQAFIGLLASRKRAATVFGALEQEGTPRERLAEVRNPVGLDLGARSPGEVAVAILAEIVAACVPSAAIDRDGGHHCCHT
jgi:xanthine dehydrogenase accessory factor